jgi:hypothetical protein
LDQGHECALREDDTDKIARLAVQRCLEVWLQGLETCFGGKRRSVEFFQGLSDAFGSRPIEALLDDAVRVDHQRADETELRQSVTLRPQAADGMLRRRETSVSAIFCREQMREEDKLPIPAISISRSDVSRAVRREVHDGAVGCAG